MKLRLLPWVVAFTAFGAGLPLVAHAQASAPATAPASAPRTTKTKPPPKLMTPEEKRDTAGHDLQPERQPAAQLTIPLSKKGSPDAKPQTYRQSQKAAKTGGGIDDATARCKAEATEQARAACLERLERDSKSR